MIILQTSFIDIGSLVKLKSIVDKHNVRKVLIVAGKKSFSLSGAQEKVKKILDGIQIVVFGNFESNPKYKDVINGIKLDWNTE